MPAKVVSFLTGTGIVGSTITVDKVGFKPQVIIFYGAGMTGAITAHAKATELTHLSWCVSATDRQGVAKAGTDNVDPTISGTISSRHENNRALNPMNTGGGGGGEADLRTYDNDGFTLVVMAQFTQSSRVFALCIAGIVAAKTGQFQAPGATGNFSVTDVGFKPDFVLFASSMSTSAAPASHTDSKMMIGMATGPNNQGVMAAIADRGSTKRSRYHISLECIATQNDATGALEERASYVSSDAGGYTVNFLKRTSAKWFRYLAIKGGSWKVGNFDGVSVPNTSVTTGFNPAAVIMMSLGNVSESTQDTADNNSTQCFGAATAPLTGGSVTMHDVDGVNPTQVFRGMRVDAPLTCVNSGGTEESREDLVSLDLTGFTATQVGTGGAFFFVIYAAFGDIGAGNYPHAGI